MRRRQVGGRQVKQTGETQSGDMTPGEVVHICGVFQ